MRLLVFSDSHGMTGKMRDAILLHPEADKVVHLGDCERDVETIRYLLGGRELIQVCGNCDFSPSSPESAIIGAEGADVFCTHGHLEGVKYGTARLADKAHNLGARIVLYGHTHIPVTDYVNGIYLFNPGTARLGQYGVIDITRRGISCSNAEL